MTCAEILVDAAGAYLAAGLFFALVFVTAGVQRVDPASLERFDQPARRLRRVAQLVDLLAHAGRRGLPVAGAPQRHRLQAQRPLDLRQQFRRGRVLAPVVLHHREIPLRAPHEVGHRLEREPKFVTTRSDDGPDRSHWRLLCAHRREVPYRTLATEPMSGRTSHRSSLDSEHHSVSLVKPTPRK